MIQKVTKKIKEIQFPAHGYAPNTDFQACTRPSANSFFNREEDMAVYVFCVIPVSDRGKVEEALALRICFNFSRGFVPASCTKITFRNHEVFGYFLPAQKVTKIIRKFTA